MSNHISLTEDQHHIADAASGKKVFLRGDAGNGKTTVGGSCLLKLIQSGVPAESILVLVPQRPLARPYNLLCNSAAFPSGGQVSVLTIGGLARRMVDLFWPLVTDQTGFTHPEKPPQFLTIETTQYFLSQVVDPLREQGAFDGLSIEPARLHGQILDNLNKTAVVGFPPTEIAGKLRAAWNGNQSDARFFDEAQDCAVKFREYCYEHSLLDFSLQLEIFNKILWVDPICRNYLCQQYRHLIYDNVEEDYPSAHDIIRDWLPEMDSALLIYDDHAGYRSFLGADPQSAARLSELTEKTFHLSEQVCTPEPISQFRTLLAQNLRMEVQEEAHPPIHLAGIALHYSRFYTQMLDAVAGRIHSLVQNGTLPGEIAVLSPFIGDSLRFSLASRLSENKIALTTHRPGRELRIEPAVRCLVTLAKLVYPQWNLPVSPDEFRIALLAAIDELDLIRADLLKQTLFSGKPGTIPLRPFSTVGSPMNERITFQVGEKYEILRNWILQARENPPDDLSIFFSRCFGELLSQKGFGFHFDYDMADATDRLIESARQFIEVIRSANPEETANANYLSQLENGFSGSLFLPPWQENRSDAVLLSPAFTFLMRNQPVKHQFWLDPGSSGWWERLNQPLTHPVVLSRNWPPGAKWTDAAEVAHNQNTIVALTGGLLCRCKGEVDIFVALVDEQGIEPRGPLLQALNRFLRYHPGGIEIYDA
ncbi:MAG: hypothetical protein WCG34_00025 [Leptolinea sp.]